MKNLKAHKIGWNVDGGGMKAIIPLMFTIEVEKRLGGYIADYVDHFSGASSGGILSSAHSTKKLTAQQILDKYVQNGAEIFDRRFLHYGYLSPKYRGNGLDDTLRDFFGDTKLKDLNNDVIIVSVDATNRKFVLHKTHDDRVNEDLLRDVVRWTASAPSYFPLTKKDGNVMIDGGMAINSPAMMLKTEMNRIGQKDEIHHIISLGTGKFEYPVKESSTSWGVIKWVEPLIDVLLSESVDVVDAYVAGLYDSGKERGKYFRINTDLRYASPKMDDASEENISNLIKDGALMVSEKSDEIDEIVNLLKTIKHARETE